MTLLLTPRRSLRHQLLGSASFTLLTMLSALPAQAQVVGTQAVSPHLVATDQLNRAPVISNGGATVVQVVLSAPVQDATTTGANYRVVSGPMTAGSLSIAGNLLTASAVGNQATSVIATPR